MPEHSSELGVASGIRASMALEAVAAETFGREDVLADVSARFAASEETIEVWETYRLVDAVAHNVIQFSSDKYWSAQYGHRAPLNRFGALNDESEVDASDVMDLDGLL